MKIRIVAVGKMKHYFSEAAGEYIKRLKRFCDLEVISLAEEGVQKESENILKKIKGYFVLLDIEGALFSSEDFASFFERNLSSGNSSFTFAIGGSDGVSEEVRKKADLKLSFGRVTYPHQLMRVLTLEQIYRAMTINNNITYHK